MPTPMGWAGLVLIAAALALLFGRLRRCDPGRAAEEQEEAAGGPAIPLPPDAAAWCSSMEALSQGAVLCLDESLCLVAAGERGSAIVSAETARAEHEPGHAHVVDIVPHEACAEMLTLTAEARRGEGASRLLPWGGTRAWVRTAPLGGHWIAVLIRSEREAAA